MDENTVRLLDLFGAYEPDETIKPLLEELTIHTAEVDMKKRSAVVTVQPKGYIPLADLRKTVPGARLPPF